MFIYIHIYFDPCILLNRSIKTYFRNQLEEVICQPNKVKSNSRIHLCPYNLISATFLYQAVDITSARSTVGLNKPILLCG